MSEIQESNFIPSVDLAPLTLRFGKYKGKTIDYIYKADKNYCRWLQSKEMFITPEQKLYLDEKLKEDDGFYLMNWGKYKGKTILWIKDNDETYFRYLRNEKYVKTSCPRLYDELQKLSVIQRLKME